jgi:hypothetical protein
MDGCASTARITALGPSPVRAPEMELTARASFDPGLVNVHHHPGSQLIPGGAARAQRVEPRWLRSMYLLWQELDADAMHAFSSRRSSSS